MARRIVTSRGRQVQIEGLEKLQANLADLIDRATAKEVKKIWMQAALELRDAAREYAPVAKEPIVQYKNGVKRIIQPGALRAAIFAAYGKDTAQDVLVGVNYKIAPHAHWLEFGNSRIPAQPYMRPAITLMRSRMVSIIADGYRRLLIDKEMPGEPNAPDGPISPPGITEEGIRRVRERARQTWSAKRSQGFRPGKGGKWL